MLDEFYGTWDPEDYERATQKVFEGMQATRAACDEYGDSRLKKKHNSRSRSQKTPVSAAE